MLLLSNIDEIALLNKRKPNLMWNILRKGFINGTYYHMTKIAAMFG